MQIGEAAAATIAKVEHDEDCYFCRSAKSPIEPETNELEEHYSDDKPPAGDLKFKNDASKLGKALDNAGYPQIAENIDIGGENFDVITAAHHLIPGNAALKPSQLFTCNKYLWKDGKVNGNIGYNINSSANGVWSPGNYAQRPWGKDGAEFKKGKKVEPYQYAVAAMKACGRQFHDAHPEYSDFVKDVLNKICEKLDSGVDVSCPEAAKREDRKPEECEPMYVLVTRLNTVSRRMAKMLSIPLGEHSKKNIYTSRFALQYMEAPIKK